MKTHALYFHFNWIVVLTRVYALLQYGVQNFIIRFFLLTIQKALRHFNIFSKTIQWRNSKLQHSAISAHLPQQNSSAHLR